MAQVTANNTTNQDIAQTDVTALDDLQVFISYARVDNLFVQRLVAEIEALDGFTPWIDTEMMIVGEKFDDTIERAIVDSSVFIFVYSDNSLASQVCNQELALARSLNKRIIPFRYRPSNRTDLPTVRHKRDDWTVDKTLLDETFAFLSSVHGIPYFDNVRLLQRDLPATEDKEVLINKLATEVEIGSSQETSSDYPTIARAIATELGERLSELTDTLGKDPAHIRTHTALGREVKAWETQEHNPSYLLRGAELKNMELWLQQSASKEPRPTEIMLEYVQASRARATRNQRILLGVVSIVGIILAVLAIFALFQANVANTQSDRANTEADGQYELLQTFGQIIATEKTDLDAEQLTSPLLTDDALWVLSQAEGLLFDIALHTSEIRNTITVGRQAQKPQKSGNVVWVFNPTDEIETLTIVDSLTGAVQQFTNLPDDIQQIVYRSDVIVAISTRDVYVFNSVDGTLIETLDDAGFGNSRLLDDGQALWVINDRTGLWRLDTASLALTSIPSFTPDAYTLHAIRADERTWFLSQAGISGIDDTGDVLERPVNGIPTLLRQDGTTLWLAVQPNLSTPSSDILQFDLARGAAIERISIGAPLQRIMPTDEAIWLFTRSDSILRYDRATGDILTIPFEGSGEVSNIAFDGSVIWFSERRNDIIHKLDTVNEVLLTPLTNCRQPSQPVSDGFNVWVSCSGDGELARFATQGTYYGTSQAIPVLRQISTDTINNDAYSIYLVPSVPILIDNRLWFNQANIGQVFSVPATTDSIQLPREMLNLNAVDSVLASVNIVQDSVVERVEQVQVGDDPLPLYRDPQTNYLWVASQNTEQVTMIDPTGEQAAVTTQLSGLPLHIERIGDYIWLTAAIQGMPFNRYTPEIYLLNPQTGIVEKQIELGLATIGLARDGDFVWLSIAENDSGLLIKMDSAGNIVGQTTLPDVAWQPAVDEMNNRIVLTSVLPGGLLDGVLEVLPLNATGSVMVYDRTTLDPISTIPLTALPSRPVVVGNTVWLTMSNNPPIINVPFDPFDSTLVAVDLQSETVEQWQFCDGVIPPYFDEETGLIWSTCVDQDDASALRIYDGNTRALIAEYCNLGTYAWTPQRIGDYVYVGFRNSSSIAIFTAEGDFVQRSELGAIPMPPIADDDGNLWFVSVGSGLAQRIPATILKNTPINYRTCGE